MYKYTNFSDDRSRVCLKGAPGVDSCDYINASFIDVSALVVISVYPFLSLHHPGIWRKKECIYCSTR